MKKKYAEDVLLYPCARTLSGCRIYIIPIYTAWLIESRLISVRVFRVVI
jgi:hypothetical protein